MTLSEAIRLGAAVSPQLTDGRYYDPETGATCGMACPALAAGCDFTPNEHGKFAYRIFPFLVEHFPILRERALIPCPVDGCDEQRLLAIHLAHLNDGHKWTRDAIANWVEGIEADQQAKCEARSQEQGAVVEVAS